jgi:hypothetical protein
LPHHIYGKHVLHLEHRPTCLLPAACCLLPAACCLLPAACCLLPAACCLLPAACLSLPLFCSENLECCACPGAKYGSNKHEDGSFTPDITPALSNCIWKQIASLQGSQ